MYDHSIAACILLFQFQLSGWSKAIASFSIDRGKPGNFLQQRVFTLCFLKNLSLSLRFWVDFDFLSLSGHGFWQCKFKDAIIVIALGLRIIDL